MFPGDIATSLEFITRFNKIICILEKGGAIKTRLQNLLHTFSEAKVTTNPFRKIVLNYKNSPILKNTSRNHFINMDLNDCSFLP